MSLSDNLVNPKEIEDGLCVSQQCLEAFIKELKEEIRKFDLGEVLESEIIEDIDKLAGEKLI